MNPLPEMGFPSSNQNKEKPNSRKKSKPPKKRTTQIRKQQKMSKAMREKNIRSNIREN